MEKYYRNPEELENMLREAIAEMKKRKGAIKVAKRLEQQMYSLEQKYTITEKQKLELPRNDLHFDDDDDL